ncbi:hypothetical protein DMP23_20995 [Amycolatopsis sp. A1MSW2902]|uniref:TauD/TfdA family dioxygenase n=1 Tax=Amycolatopsis sp. A1MSW2902 TaxID=687413 RepID=UPI00307FBC8B
MNPSTGHPAGQTGSAAAALGRESSRRAAEHGYAIVRGPDLDKAAFSELVKAIGDLSDHRFGTGEAGLLDLDASPDPEKVITGRSQLPLHTDGALVGSSPKFIVLYCHAFEQPEGSGCTEVCIQRDFLQTATPGQQRVLAGEWEYFVTDASHFPDVANRWISVPATLPGSLGPRLNLAMPFGGDPAGWQVRLPGVSAERSREALRELEARMRATASFYTHEWAAGDLLVLDNELVLHGRTSIRAGGRRHLFRGQVNG